MNKDKENMKKVMKKATDAIIDTFYNAGKKSRTDLDTAKDLARSTMNDMFDVAYAIGQNDQHKLCSEKCDNTSPEVLDEMYKKGLNDAWECARYLVSIDHYSAFRDEDLNEIFGKDLQDVLHYPAKESIEKVKKYKERDKKRDWLQNVFCTNDRACYECPLHTPEFKCGRGNSWFKHCCSLKDAEKAYETVRKYVDENGETYDREHFEHYCDNFDHIKNKSCETCGTKCDPFNCVNHDKWTPNI